MLALVAVVIAVLAVLRQEIAALTVTIIYTLLVIYEIAAAGSKISPVRVRTLLQLSYGAGMWLLIIAIIVMLIGTIFRVLQTNSVPRTPRWCAGDACAESGIRRFVPGQRLAVRRSRPE